MVYYQFDKFRKEKQLELPFEKDFSYVPWIIGIVAIFVFTAVICVL
jgi:hypothetical protein